jgi:hypothetical protein
VIAFECDVERTKWSLLRMAYDRNAAEVPGALRALAAATSEAEVQRAYWRLDNVVVVQGRVFEAAEFVVQPLLQLLCLRNAAVQRYTLDLLIELTGAAAYPDPSEVERGNAGLVERCRARAREGIAVVYGLLDAEEPWVRISAFELLEYIETDTERLLWALRRVCRGDPDAGVRERAAQVVADRSR